MLHDLGWWDLSDRRRDLRLALLYKVVTGHVAVGPDQIGLVAADNNQLRAVVVEQESPAAFKNQLDRLAPVACRMP